MTQNSTSRIAIVGAGPAGIYAAESLLTQLPGASVDLFEKLPAPYGLVRYGVAPDHPRIKKIAEALHETLANPRIRLIGNVDVGTDVSVDELCAAYDGVILATGADADAPLDIPGVDLPGSFGAADFVAWFDGHPDAPREWPLEAESIAVLGAGNVALDVARVLVKHARELASTDTPDHVLDQLAGSPVREVHLFVRRGPADVRFSPLELRELGEQHDVDVIVDADEMALDEHAERMIAQFSQRRIIVRTLTQWAQIPEAERIASRRIYLHFRQQPVRVLGDGAVTGIEMERTVSDPLGRLTGTGEMIRHSVGAVYRAVGYRSTPVPGAPFDDASGVVPHDEGRVIDADGEHVPGLYVTGWIKRGPIGLIGATKSDAAQTVRHLIEDLLVQDASGIRPTNPDTDPVSALHSRLNDAVGWNGWLRIDAAERQAGATQGRERTKLVDRSEMLEHAFRADEDVALSLSEALDVEPEPTR